MTTTHYVYGVTHDTAKDICFYIIK